MHYITQPLLIARVVSEGPQRKKWAGMARILPTSPGTPGSHLTHPSPARHVTSCALWDANPKPIHSKTHGMQTITFPLLTLTRRQILNCSFWKALSDKSSTVQSQQRWMALRTALMMESQVWTLLSYFTWRISWVFSGLLPYCSLGKLGQNACLLQTSICQYIKWRQRDKLSPALSSIEFNLMKRPYNAPLFH